MLRIVLKAITMTILLLMNRLAGLLHVHATKMKFWRKLGKNYVYNVVF